MVNDLLLLVKFLFLGLLQGFIEPIPISSSGHLELAESLLQLSITGFNFALLVNTGSLIAVLIIYREDLKKILLASGNYIIKGKKEDFSSFYYLLLLIIATIPAGLLGLLLADPLELLLGKNIQLIGLTLLLTGAFLWLIKDFHGEKTDHDISLKDAIVIGFSQSLALIPGISRSGATIVAGMLLNLKREVAFKFSFLLYIPISFGGMLFSLNNLLLSENLNQFLIPYTIAFIASFWATYFSLQWFRGMMIKGNLIYFALYCFIVGSAVIFFM